MTKDMLSLIKNNNYRMKFEQHLKKREHESMSLFSREDQSITQQNYAKHSNYEEDSLIAAMKQYQEDSLLLK